ncbi:efflux transporter [Infundibulicybe gibba]|nr:efflux transporter [Infundibulicybe gibba]
MPPTYPDKTPPLRTSKSPQDFSAIPGRSTITSVILVLTCTFAMIVKNTNSASVSVALPTIQRDFGVDEAQLQWVAAAYPLSSGCLLVVFGRLADLYGRKRTFICGLMLLAAFTLGCGFAQDIITLEILRGFQGIGSAATIPASLGILAHAFPPSRARSIAFATFAAGAPLGAAFGGATGGALTQLTRHTWRSQFFLQVGLIVVCLIGGIISIDADTPSTEIDKRVDWLGACLVTGGLVLIIFVLGQGEIAPQKWATPYIIALLVLGVFLIILFVYWQRYLERIQSDPSSRYSIFTPPPLMKVSIWSRANGRFATMMWIAFLVWCSFIAWLYWSQLYYQNLMGYTPLETVARIAPMFVSGVLCNIAVAFIVGKISLIYIIASGSLITSTACLLFAVIVPSAPYWAFGFPAAAISVMGADFIFSGGTIFIAKISLPHEQSLAGGLFQTMTQLGTTVGVTVSTVIFNRVIEQDSEAMGVVLNPTKTNAPEAAKLNAYKAAQWTAFAFGILATLLALYLRGVGVVGDEAPKPLSGEDKAHTDEKPNREI